jgi:hypothetical protein
VCEACVNLCPKKDSLHTNIFALQAALAHTSLDMVKRYLAIIQADLESAYHTASPVANWRPRTTKPPFPRARRLGSFSVSSVPSVHQWFKNHHLLIPTHPNPQNLCAKPV